MKFPQRNPNGQKGDHGKVFVVGGSDVFHGAPVLAALGAEKSGIDLLHLVLPTSQAEVAKNKILNCMVHAFSGEYFDISDVDSVDSLSKDFDVVLLGNGFGKRKETKDALIDILSKLEIPVVLDADALISEIREVQKKSDWTLTPHEGEFERLFGVPGSKEHVQEMAKKYNCTLLRKGKIDSMANSEGEYFENTSGSADMTVGGTGDALAGLIAGFIAQKLSPLEACRLATFLFGKCAEELSKTRFSFTAEEMLHVFPLVAKQYES